MIIGNKKSLSRLMAVQIFYQSNFINNGNLDKIKNDLVENYLLSDDEISSSYQQKIDEELLDNLVFGLEKKTAEIDLEIEKFLRDGFKISEMDNVMLQIFRLAVFEIKFFPQVPTNVIINEYVDIAASFFDDSKVTFVNAVIDAISKANRIEVSK
jgi:N utilization substance protein B